MRYGEIEGGGIRFLLGRLTRPRPLHIIKVIHNVAKRRNNSQRVENGSSPTEAKNTLVSGTPFPDCDKHRRISLAVLAGESTFVMCRKPPQRLLMGIAAAALHYPQSTYCPSCADDRRNPHVSTESMRLRRPRGPSMTPVCVRRQYRHHSDNQHLSPRYHTG